MKKGIESIKNNMIKKITPIIVITIAVAMGIVYFIARSSLVDNSKSYLDRISVLAASEIDALIYEIEGDSEILANGRVFFEKSTIEEKMNSLKRSNEKLKYLDLAYVDLNGKATYISGATENVKEKEGFKKALKGDTSIEILENNIEKEEYPIECISPILVNGKVDGAIIIKKNAYDLISIIKNMDLGEIGHAYIFNTNGEIISSVELNEVKNNYNIFNKIKENNSEETLKEIITNLKEEKSGILQYEEQGFYDNYLVYSPLEKTEWFIGLVVNEGVVVSGVRNIIFYVGIFLLIALAIILYRISKVVNSMTTSIDSFKDEIYKFSEGNFAAEIVKDKENEKNEIGVMYNSALDTQYSVGEILNNVKFNAEAIDMNAVGLSEIANELSKLTESIVLAIADVTEGTTSQATDLSEISMSMMSFGENIEKVSSEISEIATLSGRINDKSKNSNKELEILTKNIESFKDEFDGFNQSITNTSNEMKNINAMTDLISNISEQTNLLALNAAIEAARAGEAGRGFAVVAEEIRKLAEMSKESTTNICNTVKVILKNTEAVVEKTSVMDEGLSRQTKTIERSIGVFEDISISLGEVIPKIEAMAGSFRKITKEKTEILERVDNVSAISQEISATSEEVTASSEELNSASQEVAAAAESLTALTTDMKAGLEIFKIKDMEEIMNYKEAKYNEELKSEN